MKNYLYILILLLCFGCKNETVKIPNSSVDLDSSSVSIEKEWDSVRVNFKSDSIYKWFLPEEISSLERRNVKAINGLIVRDSLGKRIGKLDFGENIYILKYSNDTIEVKDENKIIKGRKAKVVTKWSNKQTKLKENHYKSNWYVKNEDIGFVFEGFLYNSINTEDDDSLYSYTYLTVGEKGGDSKIDLKELVQITKTKSINISDEKPKTLQSNLPEKKDGKLELSFENGKKLILKDTTFHNHEYNPTKTYGIFKHQDFPDSYMVTENMFFTPEIHTEISIKTGDTLNTFSGYPHISPKLNYAVLVTHDLTECFHDTYFQVYKKDKNNRFKTLFSYSPRSWSYPFKKYDGSMDDIFSIHWVNDKEFIIKVVDYIDDCYDADKLSEPYYLQFKIKI